MSFIYFLTPFLQPNQQGSKSLGSQVLFCSLTGGLLPTSISSCHHPVPTLLLLHPPRCVHSFRYPCTALLRKEQNCREAASVCEGNKASSEQIMVLGAQVTFCAPQLELGGQRWASCDCEQKSQTRLRPTGRAANKDLLCS